MLKEHDRTIKETAKLREAEKKWANNYCLIA